MEFLENVFRSPILPLSVILLMVLWKIYDDHRKSTEAEESPTDDSTGERRYSWSTRNSFSITVHENGVKILEVHSRTPFKEIEDWFFSGEEPCLTVDLKTNDHRDSVSRRTVLDRSRHTLVFSTYSFLSSDD